MHKYIAILVLGCLLTSCGNTDKGQQSSDLSPDASEAKIHLSSELEEGIGKGEKVKLNADADVAHAFYQEILDTYGEKCYECAEELEIKLKEGGQQSSPGTEITEGSQESSPQQLNVVIALDSSGSMAEDSQGEPRLTAAKIAISEFVDSLPETAQVSLVAFGHKGSNAAADKAISCAGIETVYPLAERDNNRFKAAVNSFSSKGYTPLADTLDFVNGSLSATSGENTQNIIYLVSDGVETCDGDPISVAKRLHESQTQLLINVIGFDVDSTAQAQLRSIAEAGGGEYYSAKGRTELQQVWEKNARNLAGYRLGNLNQQGSIFLNLTNEKNALFLCVTNKLNKERLSIAQEKIRLRRQEDPNYQYMEYVDEQLAQRRERIENWRDQLTAEIENKRDITIDQLKQDLKAAEQGA